LYLPIESASVSIRPARKSDAASIRNLVGQLAASIGETPARQLDDDYVLKFLDAQGAGVLVAEIEGKVIGMLSYTLRPNLYHAAACCMIEELVAAQGYRGIGIGGRMLDAILTLARDRGCAEASISTLPSNLTALELYRRRGFIDEAVLLEQHL
jgi:GNAT superfamily N-acetyltransferase